MQKETGLTRQEILRICHSSSSPAFKTSERGRWKIDEDKFKAFLNKRMGKFLLIVFLFTLMMCEPVAAHAETVTGSHSIGGFGKTLEDFYKAGGKLYEEEELSLLSDVMFLENYCNGEYVMLLTGSVVLNRVASKDFPNSIREVLYQRGQYATAPRFGKVDTPESVKELAKRLLMFGSILPSNVVFQSMQKNLGRKIYTVINGEYFAYG